MTFVWLNGQVCEAAQAHVSLADRGLTLGDGLFETMRVKNGNLLHLDRHMQRLQEGSAVLALPVPSGAEVAQAAKALLSATGLQNGSARLTVTRGTGPRGLAPPQNVQPTVFMTVAAGTARVASVSVMTSRLVRRDEQSPLSRIKSLNYLPNILARQEAVRAGYEDALLLNVQGRVAETTVSTVVVQEEERFITPSVAEGALPGIARSVLLRAGVMTEESVDLSRLQQAKALYLVNSLGVRVVSLLDGQWMEPCASGLRRLCTLLDVAQGGVAGARKGSVSSHGRT